MEEDRYNFRDYTATHLSFLYENGYGTTIYVTAPFLPIHKSLGFLLP